MPLKILGDYANLKKDAYELFASKWLTLGWPSIYNLKSGFVISGSLFFHCPTKQGWGQPSRQVNLSA